MHIFWRRWWHPTPVLLPRKSHGWRSLVGYSPWGREESGTTERLYFHFHALEKEMASHSSVLAWRIPRTGEPGGLPSIESHRVGHDWSDLAAAAACTYLGLPAGNSGKEPACPCRRPQRGSLIFPGSGRSPGGGNGNPLQYSCLENPLDWGAWWATVHGVAKSRTRLRASLHFMHMCRYGLPGWHQW